MNSPTRARGHPQSPRDYEEVAMRGKQDPRFDSHDDFYAFLDSNRGPPSSANGNSGVAMQVPIHPQSQTQQQQQQQQRLVPIGQQPNHSPTADQSRPPVANSFPSQRGGGGRPRPPSYSGSRSEEQLVDKSDGQPKVNRQNGRRPNKPTAMGAPAATKSGSPPRTAGAGGSPTRHADHGRPTSPGSGHLKSAESIQRLKSPSVMDCVLQPLDQKVHEYESHMHREQDEMARLDDELRALQERRSQAEERFLEAKSKHDDYRRQYQDVSRALRGEAPMPSPRERPSQQRVVSYRDEEDDDEDEEELPPPPHRRVNSQQSFGRTSQKMRTMDRFRMSLFGDR
ncbi:hypothetical protein BJ170DRAFT_681848 [Xylariales sp. AK1849]|nr:hypothetical protein BJ170DRAFT_681848 [Xylariales sp. AK1849]